MPKISVSKKLFYSLLGEKKAEGQETKKLAERLICAKAELDSEDETTLKIELNDTNRPDLWTTAGLTRQIQHYYGHTSGNTFLPEYTFLNQDPEHIQDEKKYIRVEDSIKKIRPFIVGFIISGVKSTKVIIDELIQIQEKLCDNYGQKRKRLAIGLYRADLITWPIIYTAEDPKKSKFTALDCQTPQVLEDILQTHAKGKEYGHLLKDVPLYPILRDSANEVLSMPPIINSAFLGAVKEGDASLFIECTGDSFEMLLLVANIFACDCHDLGFTIQRIESRYSYTTPKGKTVICPQVFQKEMYTDVNKTQEVLGEQLNAQEIVTALEKMGVKTNIKGTKITIIPPPYRNDFLHEVDIIEDIMMGYGVHNLTPQLPKNFTMGRLHKIEEISRRVISTMVGLEFQEMLFPYLGGKEMFVSKMYADDTTTENTDVPKQTEILKHIICVSNPLSENYEIVRPSALPNLLESERVSANSPYPHKICEIGKIVLKDNDENYGCKTNTMLSFLIANANASFTEINSVVAAVLYYEDVLWHTKETTDVRFIGKRVSKIIRNTDKICLGIFGEVHPRVLKNFDITMPCVAGEICLDLLL